MNSQTLDLASIRCETAKVELASCHAHNEFIGQAFDTKSFTPILRSRLGLECVLSLYFSYKTREEKFLFSCNKGPTLLLGIGEEKIFFSQKKLERIIGKFVDKKLKIAF